MRRILLIEDDKDLNKGLVYDLEQNGFQVYPAFTLSEGRELLKDRGWLCVLPGGEKTEGYPGGLPDSKGHGAGRDAGV